MRFRSRPHGSTNRESNSDLFVRTEPCSVEGAHIFYTFAQIQNDVPDRGLEPLASRFVDPRFDPMS